MAEMKNREGQMLMEELKGLFPEISLLLDLSKFHLMEPSEDVEIVLDQNKVQDDTEKPSLDRHGASLLHAVMRNEGADNFNGSENRLKTLLVRDTSDHKLVVSGGVVENRATGERRKLSADELAPLPTQTSGQLIVNQANYSLLQHAQDAVSGFLNPEFYARMNTTGYKPTLRSLLRHAVNSAESVVANDLTSVSHSKANQGVSDMLSYSATDVPKMMTLSTSASSDVADNPLATELRRKLGLEDSLSPLEKSTVVGLLSVGVALSLYRSNRSGLSAVKSAANHVPSGSVVRALKDRMLKRLF